MKKRIEWLAKILVYATFFAPLIVLPSSFIFPFIVPKILIIRSLVVLMVLCYIVLLRINWQEYKIKNNLLNIAMLLFLLSFVVSTFVGVDPYKSFWDNHERMLGLFTIFHYITFYFVCGGLFKKWTDWQMALRIFLFAGSLVMFVGVLQIFKPDMLMNNGNRVASTLGNPIYVGGYGLFLTFMSILLLLKEKTKFWQIFASVTLILALLGLFYSGTRGTMLGLVVGLGVSMLGYALFLKDRPRIKKTILGGVVLLVALIGVLFVFRQTSFVMNIPAVGRAINTSYTDVKNTPRWLAWEIAIESWKERPFFGWGPNNYYYAFNKYYNPKLLEYGVGETWFDNAHNIIMNTLAVQGILGLLVYLSIFVVAIYLLLRGFFRKNLDIHFTIIISGFLIAHLVQNIVVFENPTSYLYFMFCLAMVSGMAGEGKKDMNEVNKKPIGDKKVTGGFLWSMGTVGFFLVFIFNIQPARANMRALDAIRDISTNINAAPTSMATALAFNSPHVDDIRNDIARSVNTLLRDPNTKMDSKLAKQLAEMSLENIKKNDLLHPLDIRVHLSISQLSEILANITKSELYSQDAEYYLQKAVSISPKRQQLLYSLSAFQMQNSRYDEAENNLEKSIEYDPVIGEGYWRLAYVYKLQGEDAKTTELINNAKQLGYVKFSVDDLGIIDKILAIPSVTTTTVSSTN